MKNITNDLRDHIRWSIFGDVEGWWTTGGNDEVDEIYWSISHEVWRPIKDKLKDLTR